MTLLASCTSRSWGTIGVVIIIQYEKPAGIHGEDEAKRGRGETRICQWCIMPESGPGSARFRAQRADPIRGGHGGCWAAWRRAVTSPLYCTSNIAVSLIQTVLESMEELSNRHLTKRFRFHLVCHLLATLGLPTAPSVPFAAADEKRS
ncbi:hypothetical protein GGI42DRAFT_200826 [Trichoderma sp. SZMC 28013]